MSRRSRFDVHLCGDERKILEDRASSRSAPHSEVVRARIVLPAAEVAQNEDLRVEKTMSYWNIPELRERVFGLLST